MRNNSLENASKSFASDKTESFLEMGKMKNRQKSVPPRKFVFTIL